MNLLGPAQTHDLHKCGLLHGRMVHGAWGKTNDQLWTSTTQLRRDYWVVSLHDNWRGGGEKSTQFLKIQDRNCRTAHNRCNAASSSLELEEGGKLWPVYCSEIWSDQDDSWESQYLKYEDGYLHLKEGIKGTWVEFIQKFKGPTRWNSGFRLREEFRWNSRVQSWITGRKWQRNGTQPVRHHNTVYRLIPSLHRHRRRIPWLDFRWVGYWGTEAILQKYSN